MARDRGGFINEPSPNIEEFHDNPREMTFGRRFARAFSMFGWYNPSNTAEGGGEEIGEASDEGPSLEAAWAYFEHITLPRYFAKNEDEDEEHEQSRGLRRKRDVMERAEPGETEHATRLYPVWSTPSHQLADLGIGVGIYFQTLRAVSFIVLIGGIISIPNILYFGSTEYTANEQDNIRPVFQGSAMCTDYDWVACPDCRLEDWDSFPSNHDRYATNADGTLHFILNNNCNVNRTFGFISWINIIFIALSLYIMGFYIKAKEVAFDEAEQTAADYSVEVENPPVDAINPDEWRTFFQQFGHVTVCTVALDNENLIDHLVQRQKKLLQIDLLLPPKLELDVQRLHELVPQCSPVPAWKKLLLFQKDAPSLLKEINKLDHDIEEMSRKRYHVSNVFISFETERAQRKALTCLTHRRLDIWLNTGDSIPEPFRFRGKHLLVVREPAEPSSIRWDDLDDSPVKKTIQLTITTALSMILIVGGGILIALARRRSVGTSAIVITLLNTITPTVVKILTSLESHSEEGSRQTSQYIKMSLFRWINTAIITTIITPFTTTVSDAPKNVIASVYTIYFTELVKMPLIQLSDVMGNLKRHILAPRAPDQRRMNLNFLGTHYELAERYTEMTKVLFFTFYYSTIFPSGFFFAAITLNVHYWTDKFCILRTWSPAPMLGTQISSISRHFFFTAALLAYSVIASYQFAMFPYDNACESNTRVSDDYIVTGLIAYAGSAENRTEVRITVEEGDNNYFFCNQEMIRYPNTPFPALPRLQPEGGAWMTTGQEQGLRFLGWTSVVILVFVGLTFFNKIVVVWFRQIFTNYYKPHGVAMDEHFSQVKEIYGYVPQKKIEGFPFPSLLCDVKEIDEGLIGWTDPNNSYDHHNLIFAVPKIVRRYRGRIVDNKFIAVRGNYDDDDNDDGEEEDDDYPIFSIVKNWPPEEEHN